MGDVRFDKTAILGEKNFDTFGCDPYAENPDTPDRLRPDARFERAFFNFKLDLPDGDRIRIWSFRDKRAKGSGKDWPAPAIRHRQGETVHSTVKAKKGTHTIHHHGIDGTPFNDGVGHTSFEVNGEYVYQYAARNPGTYFFHCHKNTTLHFEMGMYGLLIVDEPEGAGFVRQGDELVEVDVEANWVADELDPRWRKLNQNAGLCGEDEGLNIIEPKYFVLSGVPAPWTETDRRIVASARVGQRILARVLNASYGVTRVTLPLDGRVIGVDGRTLGGQYSPWSAPIDIKAGEPFELISAQRYDILMEPSEPGAFEVAFEFLDWIRREIQDDGRGVARTFIEVAA